MFENRLSIEVVVKTLTPLHIGSVTTIPKTYIDKTGKECVSEVAEITRDYKAHPYLPGTTIKGALLSLVESQESADSLFGCVEQSDDQPALMAACYFSNAYIIENTIPEKSAHQLPYYDDKRVTATISRNAIDRDTGVAEDQHLFHLQVVPPDVGFTMKLTLFLQQDEAQNQRHRDLLFSLLRKLADENGVAIGRNQSAGYGRIQADLASLRVIEKTINSNGELCESECSPNIRSLVEQTTPPKQPSSRYSLHLQCDGPFIVASGDHPRPHKRNPDDPQTAQITPLRFDAHQVWLPGTSLLGVLRSECALLSQHQLLRGESDEFAARDDRNIIYRPDANPAKGVAVRVSDLSPIEILFGVTGWRGLLCVEHIRLLNEPEFIDLTSVKIDRFSGAPIDHGLFMTKAALDPEFAVTLSIEHRNYQNQEQIHDQVTQLFHNLIDRIVDKGITLGHGGNKGFGWFTVKRGKKEEQAA